MFRRLNDAIDYSELERRVSLEVAELSRREPDATRGMDTERGGFPRNASEAAETEAMHLPPDEDRARPDRPAEPAGIRARLALLTWGAFHLRTILRRAVVGVHLAEQASRQAEWARARLDEQAAQNEALSEKLASAIAGQRRIADTLIARLDQSRTATDAALAQLEDLSSRLDRLTAVSEDQAKQSEMLRNEIMFQQRRLARIAGAAQAAEGQGVQTPIPSETARSILDERFDSLYAAFEDKFRGSREEIKRRLVPYVDRLILAGSGASGTPILDIGCGRGEWLELLQEHGLHAYGIDVNGIMVARACAAGVDARQSDLMTHLRGLADGSLSAITAFHVVEHLPFAMLVDFLDEALRALAPGGLILLETPNAETIRVGATTFYNDPTHRNPLMPEPLRFIVEHRGFVETEVLRLHPFTEGLLQERTADAAMLNRILFGPQDYGIIARRL